MVITGVDIRSAAVKARSDLAAGWVVAARMVNLLVDCPLRPSFSVTDPRGRGAGSRKRLNSGINDQHLEIGVTVHTPIARCFHIEPASKVVPNAIGVMIQVLRSYAAELVHAP
jgi:hypothetical protein